MCKIVHLTSAHPRNDIRIFIKQCRTLAAHGYDVTLVVADGKGDAHVDGVTIADVGRLPGRLNRIFKVTKRVFDKAVALDADIYQFHDPELLPAGLKLKRLGKTVIFDSHEDTASQLVGKPYLDPLSRRVLPAMFAAYERFACSRFDGVIAATPCIRDLFLKINPVTVDINNFPIVGEFSTATPWNLKKDEVCYVGAISGIRGIRQMVRAASLLQSGARLNLAGRFFDPVSEAQVRAHPGWGRVADLGLLDRAGVRDVMARSVAGLVTLLPLPNHVDSLPTKMFEYMSSGIPVIASNFKLWREIVEGNECGICVDPLDPQAIATAIDYLVCNPDIAKSMGERGRRAVMERYNWDVEATRLTDFYGARSNAKQAIATV
ncbi:glycosyltransferase family 4 protein [Massilia sp. H6]|uniref:glycosyltransferase family 4 protein n=1 Tax=Massilia sp. H6 TaxID=2970464 RepID=UPI0021694A7F|nr:glycosyltransferase family 4 protein [Massilia sp. H6]UVW30308.1 glycosyltransferase family 4 protein [Massilia sp. H6]